MSNISNQPSGLQPLSAEVAASPPATPDLERSFLKESNDRSEKSPEIFQTSLAIMDNISQKAASSLPSNNCYLSSSHAPGFRTLQRGLPASQLLLPFLSSPTTQTGWTSESDELTKPRVVSNPKAPQGLQSVPGHSALSIARHFQPGGQQKQQRMMRCTVQVHLEGKNQTKQN